MKMKGIDELVVAITVIVTFVNTDVSALQCYRCHITPPPGEYYNTTNLCSHFDNSLKFIVECPYSTMCMKKEIQLEIQDGVRIHGVHRDCAPQKHEYKAYVNGAWESRLDILEPYKEGCQLNDYKEERIANPSFCYCRNNLCNASPPTNHEGYTDIMGVIVVFNLMKYINSLR